MATTKITDLTAYTDPVNTDVLPIVDVTSDVTKKVSIANVMKNASLGTAALPGIAFDGDLNTGIYSPGADQVAISTGGSGRLFINSSGNIGINTSSPSRLLHISASGDSPVRIQTAVSGAFLEFQDSGTTAGRQPLLGAIGDNIVAYTSAGSYSEKFRITPAGLVGVGTSSPEELVHIASTSAGALVDVLKVDNQSGATNTEVGIVFENGTDRTARISSANTGSDIGPLKFWTAGSVDALTERMRIDSSGRVGIGTTSPGSPLQVNGAGGIRVNEDGAGTNQIQLRSDWAGQGPAINVQTNQSLIFTTNATERVRIDTSGRLGIGTTSPVQKLEVAESDSTTVAIRASNSTGNFSLIRTSSSVNELRANDTGPIVFSHTAGTAERARIDSSGRLLVGTSTSLVGAGSIAAFLQVSGTSSAAGASFTRFAGANAGGPTISLNKTRSSTQGTFSAVLSGDNLGDIFFNGDDGAAYQIGADIFAEADADWAAGDCPTRLVFSTTADGASSPTERMRINNAGDILFVSSANKAGIDAGTADGKYFSSTGARLISSRSATTLVAHQIFINGNGQVGSITTDGSATSYTTSSDYRLKENITLVTDGITRLQQLKPSRFNFIADPIKTVDGFIAHEVQAVVPEAITGEKDAEDADGNPIYQGIDQSKLVPLLTAALQEAIAKIESLEARLTAAGI